MVVYFNPHKGQLNYKKLIRLLSTLHSERSEIVWRTALECMRWIDIQISSSFDVREQFWFSKFMVEKLRHALQIGETEDFKVTLWFFITSFLLF